MLPAKLSTLLGAPRRPLTHLRGRSARWRALITGIVVVGVALATWQLSARAQGGGPPSQMPPGKAALLHQEATQIAKARQHPLPKLDPSAVVIPTVPPPVRRAGIIDMRQGPFEPVTFQSMNAWRGPLHGEIWALVYAGQREYPAPHGALYVEHEGRAPDGQFTYQEMGYFLAPTGEPALRVVGWSGTVLALRTTTGVTIHFDVATDQYEG